MIISKRFNSVLFKDDALENGYVVFMKLLEGAISFILEDFVEVGLQFFYFEKYALMPNDLLVYFNAVIMVLKALQLTVRMILELKNQWNPAKWGISDPVYSGSF